MLDMPPMPAELAAVSPAQKSMEDRVLGAATAEQVLDRWHGFVEESSQIFRQRITQSAAWHRLPVDRPPGLEPTEREAAASSGAPDVQQVLGLSSSPAQCMIGTLLAAVSQARACAAAAPAVYRPFLLFGEAQKPELMEEERAQTLPAVLVELAELLPDIERLQSLLERVAVLAQHLIRQLVGLHTSGPAEASGLPAIKRLPVQPVLDVVGELLAIPAVGDGIFLDSPRLQQAYATFSWTVSKASTGHEGANVNKLEIATEAAVVLGDQLRRAEPLISGNTFQNCLTRITASLEDLSELASTLSLREQFMGYFRARLEESDGTGTAAVAQLLLPAESLIPWVSAFVLCCRIWRPGRAETRLAVEALKLHRLSPAVVIYGRFSWCIFEFLLANVPALVSDGGIKKEAEDLKDLRHRQAARLDDGRFVQEMQRSRTSVQVWLANLGVLDRALRSGNISHAMKDAQVILLRGLGLALRIRASLEEFLVLHVREAVPVPRSCLHAVSLGFQLLKSVEAGPSSPRWAELTVLLQQHLALQLHTELEDIRGRLGQRSVDVQVSGMLKVAVSAVYCTVGGVTHGQLDSYFEAGVLALCCAGQGERHTAGTAGSLRQLRIISRWKQQLKRLCDTTWSYWVRELFPELLADLRDRSRGAAGLPALCNAFASALDGLLPLDSPIGICYSYELQRAIDSRIITPVCESIEQDLRLHTHAVMQASLESLPKVAVAQPEVMSFLGVRPLCFASYALIDIKDEVELRLSRTFYDLTALAPQLAETYERMRFLSEQRYGLKLIDGRLPAGSLDHGLDVIDIMRNVHLFSAQYSYSLHQQLFVQSLNQGDAKVRTIAMEHLTTSIQTHGAGVINTTVNYIYGFLKRKLEVVVEFLGDESVKSRMLTDRQWMAEQRSARRGYTWARAAETARFIRNLGGGSDGVYFLDKLRKVVTQIGNSLGYVRMVRTAGMRCVSGSLPYTDATLRTSVDHRSGEAKLRLGENKEREEEVVGNCLDAGEQTFSEAAKAAICPPLIAEAAGVADEALQSVRRCFDSSTDYLHLYAQVFAKALGDFNSPGTSAATACVSPAQLFHLLVPALSLSFLDALLIGREALTKRAVTSASSIHSNAMCFDDGFALGIACILRIFRLDHDFQAMHWFKAQILESDVAMGQTRTAAGGAPFAEGTRGQPSVSRRDLLAREMGYLAATFEAATSLFGPADVDTMTRAAPYEGRAA